MSRDSKPTTTREAEKLAWMAAQASNTSVRQQARETLLRTRDEHGFIKVYDEENKAYCLFKVPDTGRCKVASCHYDFDEDEDEETIAQMLLPYLSDSDLKPYIRYFLG